MAVLSMDVGSQEQLLMLDQSSPCLGWTSRGQLWASMLLSVTSDQRRAEVGVWQGRYKRQASVV